MKTATKGFVYRKRDPSQIKRLAERRTGGYDSIVKDQYQIFTPSKGENTVRFLPPTWDPKWGQVNKDDVQDHYAFIIKLHYDIGPDQGRYLCLEMLGQECPICEERRSLNRAKDEDTIKALRSQEAAVAWVIDRDNKKEGPKLWTLGARLDKRILSVAMDRRGGEPLYIDDPENGRDVSFRAEGEGKMRQYYSEQVDSQPSPISDEEDVQEKWLRFVSEHPIPECLNFYSAEYIKKVFSGQAETKIGEDQPTLLRNRSTRDRLAEEGNGGETTSKKTLGQEIDDEVPAFEGGKKVQTPETAAPVGNLSRLERLRRATQTK